MADLSETQSTDSPQHTFRFKIRAANIIKDAIFALTDTEFNPNSTAVIEVRPDLFEITVWKSVEPNMVLKPQFDDHTAYGILRLQATGLEEFKCINPLRKNFNLSRLSESLANVADTDVVTVCHLSNTPDILYFDFGSAPNKSVQLTLTDVSFGPTMTSFGPGIQSVVASKDLKAVAEKTLNMAPEQCPYIVRISETAKASFEAGTSEAETMPVEHELSFKWRYWGALMKALNAAEECLIFIVTLPGDESVESAVIRFELTEVGTLVLMEGQILLFRDTHYSELSLFPV